jgi:hypothetical protein
VLLYEVSGREDEDLAHQIRVLLVAAHETDHAIGRPTFLLAKLS